MAMSNNLQQQHANGGGSSNNNNHNNNHNNNVRQTYNSFSYLYTWQLPYGVRRETCDLLDADQSWRTLGGQFMGMDATQLTLIGQAYQRYSSPTEELLQRLDSANARVSDFCHYLESMNHWRALEILRPYLLLGRGAGADQMMISDESGVRVSSPQQTTLTTPNPSFSERDPSAMDRMDIARMIENGHNSNLAYPELFPRMRPTCVLRPAQQDSTPQQNQVPDTMADGFSPNVHARTVQGLQRVEQQDAAPAASTVNPASDIDRGFEIVRKACTNNHKRTNFSSEDLVNQIRLSLQVDYKELKQACDNFAESNVLGKGGFASVYRGNWKGTDVAIKRLKCNLMDQALNELIFLNSYRIDNILPIYGISIDGPEACLVYQFMCNGSLEDRLHCKKGTPPLTWIQRALIGHGLAKGLHFLHTTRNKPLVHGDVKSANVLLDTQFVPKLGDFGLARQVFRNANIETGTCTSCTVSSIHGTQVYLPPEYLRKKILSPAVDVYSYGIVLLEMATGKKAYDGKRLLIDLVQDETSLLADGVISYSLKDPRLTDDTESDLTIWFELLIKLGLVCGHKIKKKRPDMRHILDRYTNFFNTAKSATYDSEGRLVSQHFDLDSLGKTTSVESTRPSQPPISTQQEKPHAPEAPQPPHLHHQPIPAAAAAAAAAPLDPPKRRQQPPSAINKPLMDREMIIVEEADVEPLIPMVSAFDMSV